jgi:hypothetical protein
VTGPKLEPAFSGGYSTQNQAAEHTTSIPNFQLEWRRGPEPAPSSSELPIVIL